MKIRHFNQTVIAAVLVLVLLLSCSGYAAVPIEKPQTKAHPQIKVIPPTITITSPQSGAKWFIGRSSPVTWTYTGVTATKFSVGLYQNGQLANSSSIMRDVTDSQVTFHVPDDLAPGPYELWVTSQDMPTVVSKQPVFLGVPPTFTTTKPGETIDSQMPSFPR